MKQSYLLLFLVCFSCERGNDIWTPLWNGEDMSGWHPYFGNMYQQSTDDEGNPIEKIGIDNDPYGLLSIVDLEDGRAIRLTGEAFGMIYTEEAFENYHLKLKIKWGEDKHPPRQNQPRDSGLLYHGFGEPGGVYDWMNSQELQIQQGDMGDYWPVGDVEIDIPSVLKDTVLFIYKDGAPLRKFYFADFINPTPLDSVAMRRCFKGHDAEKSHGEWNDVELYCFEGSSIYVVNGEVVMKLFNSRSVESGVTKPLTKGRIGIQSEGAEVFYKDISIRSIDKLEIL